MCNNQSRFFDPGIENVVASTGAKARLDSGGTTNDESISYTSQRRKSTKEDDKLIQEYFLPWFAVVTSPKSEVKVWRQRSYNSKNYKFVSPEVTSERRTIKIKNKTIEILMCGEIFSPTIKSSLISRNINVAIDLGHTSLRFRVALAMQVLAKNGVNAYCYVHAETMNAMKHGYIPNGTNAFKKVSSRTPDILIDDDPRIEIKTWEI